MSHTFRIAAVAAAFFSMPACAEWISLQRTVDAEEFFDPSVISREQSRIRFWTLTNFSKPMTSLEAREYRSEKVLTTVDCATGKSGAEQVIRYSEPHAVGEVIGKMETPLRLSSVRPGSADEALLRQICR